MKPNAQSSSDDRIGRQTSTSITRWDAMRQFAPAVFLAMALGGQPASAAAQYLAERTLAPPSREAFAPLQLEAPTRPRAWPYVLTGAALRAVAMGVGIAVHLERTNAEFLASPFSLLPAIAAGAAFGGVPATWCTGFDCSAPLSDVALHRTRRLL
jgi:hypothetical protein